jgi:hypothetical protein
VVRETLRRADSDFKRLAGWSVSRRGGELCDSYQSDDLTFASSIAYYALLSLFPCLLSRVVDPGQRHVRRNDAILSRPLCAPVLPAAVRVHHCSAGGVPACTCCIRSCGQRRHDLGSRWSFWRDHFCGQPRMECRGAAQLLEAQTHRLRDAGRGGALLLLGLDRQ